MKTKTGIILKFGDKVLNQYASERNPHRIGVVIKISSQFIFLTDMKKGYWQLPNDRQLKIEVVGSIFSDLKSAKEEVKSAEEILKEKIIALPDGNIEDWEQGNKEHPEVLKALIEAMHEYASQFQSVQSKEEENNSKLIEIMEGYATAIQCDPEYSGRSAKDFLTHFKKFSLLEESETVTSSDTIVQPQPGRGAEEWLNHWLLEREVHNLHPISQNKGLIVEILEEYRTQSEGKDMYSEISDLLNNKVKNKEGIKNEERCECSEKTNISLGRNGKKYCGKCGKLY